MFGRFILILLAAGAACFFFFYPAILSTAGRYLAPEGTGGAEVVILEGTEVVKESAVRIGLNFISTGRAERLVIVYQNAENDGIFGLSPGYDLFLAQKLGERGLKGDQIQIFHVPQVHPITLTEAQFVLSTLSRKKVQKAILVTEDFHTRRSYWTYKGIGAPLGIDIIPYPNFPMFKSDNWWQEGMGVRSFLGESVKFFYYWCRGYIPFKSLAVN